MIEIITSITVFICSISIFWYANKVFTKPVTPISIVIPSLFNALFFYENLVFGLNMSSYFMMILTYILLFIEFKLVFSADMKITLFGMLSFGTCFFAIHSIVVPVIAIVIKEPIYLFMTDPIYVNLSRIITYLIMTLYLILLYGFMPMKIITVLLSNKQSTNFAIGILGTISVYLCINKFSFYIPIDGNMMIIFNLKVGITALIGFGLVLIYSNIFSQFLLKKIEISMLKKNITMEYENIKVLEKQKDKDSLTGIYLRNVAENAIEDHLKSNLEFNVIFLDIDGLKYANDKFGHNEGDFYIKKVAEIIITIFNDSVVSRFGGDEFVVVSTDVDEYSINRKVSICADSVKAIKDTYGKSYETSVSYGVTNIKANSKYSITQIIKIADDRMYAFKIKNKKQRR